MAMTLYMTPGSCSTGIHLLLEHLELPFSAHVLNLPAGEHRQPAYLAVNPKGSIPALRLDDGQVLTEFEAIACWLAWRHPRAGLLPAEPLAAAQALGLMSEAVHQLHGQAFARVFTPERFVPPGAPAALQPGLTEAVVAQGRTLAADLLQRLDARVPAEGLVNGSRPGLADAALFYPVFWAERSGLALPPRITAWYARMWALPVVRRVLAEEGYRPPAAAAQPVTPNP